MAEPTEPTSAMTQEPAERLPAPVSERIIQAAGRPYGITLRAIVAWRPDPRRQSGGRVEGGEVEKGTGGVDRRAHRERAQPSRNCPVPWPSAPHGPGSGAPWPAASSAGGGPRPTV